MGDIHIGFVADISDGKAKVKDAQDTVVSAMQKIADAFEGKGKESKKAIEAIGLAADQMGVKVTGNVAEIIAALPGVAAAFEAAVPVLNLLALVDVLDQVVDKIKAWSEEMGGLTEDVKSGYNALVQLNGQIIKFNEGLEIQQHHIAEGVLSGVTRLKQEQTALTADANTYNVRLRETETRIGKINDQLHGTHKETETFGEGPDIGEREIEVANRDALSKDQITALEKEYEKLIQDSEQYRENIRQIQTIKLPSLAGQADATAFKQKESDLAQLAAAHKKTVEDGIKLELDANRLRFANGQITAEQLNKAEMTAIEKRYRAEVDAINKAEAARVAAARREDPTKIAGIQAQAREQRKQAELQYQDEVVKAAEKSVNDQKKLLADLTRFQEQQEKERTAAMLAEVDRRVKDQIKAIQIQQDAAKAHKDALDQIEKQRLDFELQIGQISQTTYERELKERLDRTYAEAREELKARLQVANLDKSEEARIRAELQKLDDKYQLDSEKAEQQSLLRRRQKFDQYFQQISGAFTSALNSWIQGTESFGQAWTKMVQNMAMMFISSLEKQLFSFIEHKLMEVAIHTATEKTKDEVSKATHAKEDIRTAYGAAKGAWESTVHIPIVGPVLAPIAAATTFAAVAAFGSAEGGQWEVPGIQPTILHPQEMVLPARIASRMRDVVEHGGSLGSGGSPMVFAPTIHALDAQGVDRVLARHQRVFENRVDKVLKKRGFFAK